jgi:signal transduction histidine kinase
MRKYLAFARFERGHDEPSANDPARRLLGQIGLAATVGAAYFLVAWLSVGLVLEPEGVSVFWPAAGITSGFLIALGPRARWPMAAGVIGASVAVHLAEPLWAGIALGICNAAETLTIAGLLERYFGAEFNLDRLSHVIGLLAAAIAGTIFSGIGGAVTYRLLHGPSAAMLITWQHWFASDIVGIVAVAPLVIGVATALRLPLLRSELIEGLTALAATALMTASIIFLSRESWDTVLPIAWLLPILLWLAARCRPVFAAAAAFIVSAAIVWTTIFGIGHFGDTSLSIADRILEAQACILFVALSANVLAALFAERRESEAQLAHSNMLLERERDNKLMNLEAVTASIAHEVGQPLAAVGLHSHAAARYLRSTPPNFDKIDERLRDIDSAGQQAANAITSIRALFKSARPQRAHIAIDQVVQQALTLARHDLQVNQVSVTADYHGKLPAIEADPIQLQQVVLNLIKNAIEAMATTAPSSRAMRITTSLGSHSDVLLLLEDTGPGLAADANRIFEPFVTTKPDGMGLGLAISRTIIEGHRGTLRVAKTGPHGTIFELALPLTVGLDVTTGETPADGARLGPS